MKYNMKFDELFVSLTYLAYIEWQHRRQCANKGARGRYTRTGGVRASPSASRSSCDVPQSMTALLGHVDFVSLLWFVRFYAALAQKVGQTQTNNPVNITVHYTLQP